MIETRAIILAAGQGNRLRPYTDDRPKCLVELAGKTLLEHQIESLRKAGVDGFGVITGYRADQIESLAPRLGFSTFHNPKFDTTNMVASLMCAKEWMSGNYHLVICYGDIVFELKAAKSLLASRSALATTIDLDWQSLWEMRAEDPLLDAETLRFGDGNTVVELGKKPKTVKEIEGQYMGLIRVDASFALAFRSIYEEMDPAERYDDKDLPNLYMTSYLQYLIDAGHPLEGVKVEGGWLETDTVEDLDMYNRMQEDGSLAKYWRPA